MSEHKNKKVDTTDYSAATKDARVLGERNDYEHPGFFLRCAVWIVSRFPITRNKYQNWTTARTIIVGWLLWLIVLPIIPIVAAVIWYVRDPESFKTSPWAKALLGLAVAWAGYAGVILTNPSQANVNGKYSPIQTQPNGEVTGETDALNTASASAKQKVAAQKESKNSGGRTFTNCTAAFEAGVFDIKRSNASYEPRLDRDNDGIACEK
ncbi:excalibur calcium-binding domain-containing protein [Candidatus Saccharibacteria bacterium]|nr:MAG: excalibur calcium-binding domain-containing protein [Candidatus Saccharibacteria bacterium]